MSERIPPFRIFPIWGVFIALFAIFYLLGTYTSVLSGNFSVVYLVLSMSYFFGIAYYYALIQSPYTRAYKKYTPTFSPLKPLTTNRLPPKARKRILSRYPDLKVVENKIRNATYCLFLTPVLWFICMLLIFSSK